MGKHTPTILILVIPVSMCLGYSLGATIQCYDIFYTLSGYIVG